MENKILNYICATIVLGTLQALLFFNQPLNIWSFVAGYILWGGILVVTIINPPE